MKTSDIARSPLVRKYGLRGARCFAVLWFSFMYALLTALVVASWFLAPEYGAGRRRLFLGCIFGCLTVLVPSLLTRMLLNYLAAIRRLESEGRPGGSPAA